MLENLTKYKPGVNIVVIREDNGELVYQGHNVICNTAKWLFSRLMANAFPADVNPPFPLSHETLYGVWGLALGRGDSDWAPETQPDATSTQTALFQQVLRKPLSKIAYVDGSNNPLNQFSLVVAFQTVINATTDNIVNVPIREMGLLGGGSTNITTTNIPTNMQTAPYFDPTDVSGVGGGPTMDSVILINYKTLPPLILPGGTNVIFSWIISF